MNDLRDWLHSHSVPLSGPDPALPESDLAPLLDMLRPARLVGLGEASHGGSDFFRLKHRIIAGLSRDPSGLGHVLFESPLPRSLQTQAWVHGGVGSIDEALMGLGFQIWWTQEVAELLEWLRSSAPHTELVGIDIQDPDRAVDALDCPQLGLTSLTAGSWHDSTPAERRALVSGMVGLDTPMARNIRRWVDMANAADGGHDVRERAMAEHALEALGSTEGRSVLWAHNGHVSRGGMAGWDLSSMRTQTP